MAKKSQTATRTKSATRSDSPPVSRARKEAEKTPARSAHPIRETIEQIAFAFVLAFLFRTFEAEAFVIPTGSMAPTLMGRHKDLECTKCHYHFPVSASTEEEVAQANPDDRRGGQVITATCPQCRFTMDVDPESPTGEDYPAFNGDRILVAKFPYEVTAPKRWDVTVFHYPGDAKMNYIKRLVGLPGETLKISHGDLFTKADGAKKFDIQRKPAEKVQAMLQVVYDNDYIVDSMTNSGWPLRWQPTDKRASKWEINDGGRSFNIGSTPKADWIRYHHLLPTPEDWAALEAGSPPSQPPRPQLIRDFYAYNTGVIRNRGADPQTLGLHWVGDLSLEAHFDVKSKSGQLVLDLVEGGRHYGCTIDLQTGKAQLSAAGNKNYKPIAQTAVRGPGSYTLQLANVDEQLLLWVDGSLVEFDSATAYPSETKYPTREDLAPAGIGVAGAEVSVNAIKVSRDIYYIADASRLVRRYGGITDYTSDSPLPGSSPEQLAQFFSSPDEWDSLRPGGINAHRELDFPLAADQFFVLGDNSPYSKDARLWDDVSAPTYGRYVSRDLLIGKALYIYWPHAWPAKYSVPIRAFGNEIRVPFWPNFKRMRFVR